MTAVDPPRYQFDPSRTRRPTVLTHDHGSLPDVSRTNTPFVAHPPGEELVLGLLEDGADPADQFAGPPAPRLPVPAADTETTGH